MSKKFTLDTFYTEEEAKNFVQQRRWRKYHIGYSEYWNCYIVTHHRS